MKLKRSHGQGFLVLEILIAGLILTSSIAATMYMFRVGSLYLEKANQSNILSSKLVQASNLFKSLELERSEGAEEMGEGVRMTWKAQLLSSARPPIGEDEFIQPSLHEIMLYRVNFDLSYQEAVRSYQINVFRYHPLYSVENEP